MTGSSAQSLLDDLRRDPARVVVWGLGYVGLTTAHALLARGVRILGIDSEKARIRQLQESTITLHRSLPGLQMDFRDYIARGQMSVATRLAPPAADQLIHFVCVPTESNGTPGDGALKDVISQIGSPPTSGCIIIESTIAPRWLDHDYLSGGRLCLAPRRDWFHSAHHTVQTLTRVIAATDGDTEHLAREVLGLISRNIVCSNNQHAVAFSKAYENSLWLLMATYTNYLSQAFAHIDMREVIRLSQTNWRTPFDLYPSLRVGGYCLPLSIEYIAEARPHSRFQFAEAVKALNDTSIDELTSRLLAARPERVLVLGLSYRPEVRVHANSAGLFLARTLREHGVTCRVHDPLYSPAEIRAITGASAGAFPDDLVTSDAVVLCVAHAEYRGFEVQAFLSDRLRGEVKVYDGTGIWSNSMAGAGDNRLQYFNLGTPSWISGGQEMR